MARTVMKWSAGNEASLIEFDAVEIEAPKHAVAITTYPIEAGADLIDHVRQKAVELSLTCHITNSPSRYADPKLPGYKGLTQLDGAVVSRQTPIQVRQPLINAPTSLQLPGSFAGVPLERTVTVMANVRTWTNDGAKIQRVQNIYGLLVRSMNEAREWTVTTDLFGDFDRMLISGVDPSRDNKSGNGIKVQITLQQVFYAQLMRRDVTSLLPKKPNPKAKASEEKKDEGKKEPEEADKKTEGYAEQIVKAARGLIGLQP